LIIHLPTLITVIIDIAAWFLIHMGVAYLVSLKPRRSFDTGGWLYRQRKWEKEGAVYQGLFRINKWKEKLPDGAALFKTGFAKKRLAEYSKSYFDDFILETCRAEMTHWIAFLFGFLFFIWNIWWVGIVMVVYAMAANMPCILTQRYNRIRLSRVRDVYFK
jgi:glycosyl-4,4'-diaponeurosporenoate acyltransferase